jgi:hypothetical protein
MKFLFWNVGIPKPTRTNPGIASPRLIDQIGSLAAIERPDVLTLIEFGDSYANKQTLCPELRTRARMRYWCHSTTVPGLAHFTVRFGGRFQLVPAPLVGKDMRYDMRRVRGAQREILLVSVHAPSKLHRPDHDQELFMHQLARYTDQIATGLSLPAVVLGDLNADPFEPSVAGIQYLHGVMTTDLTKPPRGKPKRLVYGLGNPAMYNPMWSLFGDRAPGAPGTFHFAPGAAYQLYWHIFDQVLLSRPLVDPVNRLTRLEVVSRIGPKNLVDEVVRRRRRGQWKIDHLPVVCELDL